jgi:hypothetical protein
MKITLMEQLPREIIFLVYEFLEEQEIHKLCLISKNLLFAKCSTENQFWERKYQCIIDSNKYFEVLKELNNVNENYRQLIVTLSQQLQIWNEFIEQKSKQLSVKNRYEYIGKEKLKSLFEGVICTADLIEKFGTGGPFPVDGKASHKNYQFRIVTTGEDTVGKTHIIAGLAYYHDGYNSLTTDTVCKWLSI